MKLQVAIDRVTLAQCIQISLAINPYVNIIEIGTSLIKDYGMRLIIRELRSVLPNACILADLKIIDEAEYESVRAYEAGADIITVMGAASLSTIKICEDVANKYGKSYMVDLLEVEKQKVLDIQAFSTGIFCFHNAADAGEDTNINVLINKINSDYSFVKRRALAGGINIGDLDRITQASNIELLVVGSAITKQSDVGSAAKKFMELIK